MLYFVKGDIVEDKQYQIFCQFVNCSATMYVGLTGKTAVAYPEIVMPYYELCWNKIEPGKNLYVKCRDNRYCVNMFVRRAPEDEVDINALKECLDKLKKKLSLSDKNLTIAFSENDWCKEIKELKIQQDIYILRSK